MDEQPNKLDEMLIELGKMLLYCRSWWHMYRISAENAPALRKEGFTGTFGLIQDMTLRCLSIELYNIFDSGDYWGDDVVTIPHIIKEMKNMDLKNKVAFCKALLKLEIKIDQQLSDEEIVSKSFDELNKRRPNLNTDPALIKIGKARNKFFAHRNYRLTQYQRKEKITLPSDVELNRLFTWVDDFQSTIYKGFIPNTWPVSSLNEAAKYEKNIKETIAKILETASGG